MTHTTPPDEPRLRRSFQDDVGRIVTRRLRAAVAEDAAARLETQLLPEVQEALPVRYGTTLLLSLITEQSVLLGQLGDGDMVWLRADGHFDQPFASSEPAIGTETDSLCSSEATLRWQTTSFDRGQGGTLFLASDGVGNCFADERGLQDYLRQLAARFDQFGPAVVADQLPGWLDQLSAQGCRDDITLVAIRLNNIEL